MDERSENALTPESQFASDSLPLEVERLRQLAVKARWLVVLGLWLTVGLLSVWGLRSEISLWLDYFTWVAVRYGLAYHRLWAMGLALCIGMTVAVLLRQSRTILLGRSPKAQHHLEQQVLRIRRQGPSHPLWDWVCRK